MSEQTKLGQLAPLGEPDNVFAAADEQHRPPDWMVEQEAVEQARREMEEVRAATAARWEAAKAKVAKCTQVMRAWIIPELVHRDKELMKAGLLDAQKLVEALKELEELEGGAV